MALLLCTVQIIMPSTIRVSSNQIYLVKHDRESDQEPVSNFSIEVLGTVQVSTNAGGPGLLLKLQRYPDNTEKYATVLYAYQNTHTHTHTPILYHYID